MVNDPETSNSRGMAGGEVEEAAVIRQLSGITVDMFQ
jgi:hypothetical protein